MAVTACSLRSQMDKIKARAATDSILCAHLILLLFVFCVTLRISCFMSNTFCQTAFQAMQLCVENFHSQ